jgi:Cof subfamily protein (haloacid dehalogenase superfamily)
VSDLDATLLNSKSCISDKTANAINALISKGMLFTYATARSYVSAEVVTNKIHFKIPVITYNGTFIFDPLTKTVIDSRNFEKSETAEIMNVFREKKYSPIVYSFINGVEKVSWNCNRESTGTKHYLSLRKKDKRLRPLTTDENLYEGDVFYYTCIGEQNELKPIYERLIQNTKLTITMQQEINRTEYWLEIMPSGVSKANAIQTLKTHLNCDRVVSFGDAWNDISMFQISDEAYAVQNAVLPLKEIATAVIESNDEDGVAKWLEQNVFLGQV